MRWIEYAGIALMIVEAGALGFLIRAWVKAKKEAGDGKAD